MTPLHAAIGVLVGFCSGVLSGMFGVGGGIVMTPAIQLLLLGPRRSWLWRRRCP